MIAPSVYEQLGAKCPHCGYDWSWMKGIPIQFDFQKPQKPHITGPPGVAVKVK